MSARDGGRQDSIRFTNRVARYSSIALGLFFALIGLAQLMDSSSVGSGARIFGACVVVGGFWFSWRGYRSATVLITRDRVVTRSFLRSRSYEMVDVAGASVDIGRTGLGGFGREYLVLDLADGSRVLFKELNAPAATSEEQEKSVVIGAVEAIRDQVYT